MARLPQCGAGGSTKPLFWNVTFRITVRVRAALGLIVVVGMAGSKALMRSAGRRVPHDAITIGLMLRISHQPKTHPSGQSQFVTMRCDSHHITYFGVTDGIFLFVMGSSYHHITNLGPPLGSMRPSDLFWSQGAPSATMRRGQQTSTSLWSDGYQ